MADSYDFQPSIQLVEQAIRAWIVDSETSRLKQLLRVDTAEVSVPDELFAQYARDAPDDRVLSEILRSATAKARADWHAAAPTFCDEMVAQPDYDVPFMWLAKFLKQSGDTELAVALLRYAATRCRRKSILLSRAGEYLLFAGRTRESVHAYAQSIAGMVAPPQPGQFEQQRSFLCMAELLEVFEDVRGWRWIRRQIQETVLGEEFARTFRDAAFQTSTSEREQLLREVPLISRRLRQLFPREPLAVVPEIRQPASWLRDRREQRTRQLMVRSWAGRIAAKRDANPPLPTGLESAAQRVAELAVADHRAHLALTDKQRKQWHDRQYLDHLAGSGEQPEKHLRAVVELRAIGHQLDKGGGINLMIAVAERAEVLAGANILRDIEICWDGIGDWMG
ncbi:hypothetical protein M8542_02650 [Amycolatopsis sp. OK19-0408]|uniref:Uncharacterized protein n=1 Tax=Amycolatopsis iheyensis TaxID=2945988 RepID=A0A9X2N5I3_9PSEU|nr:hypothetical protein [Amycolatopsis iheyensis]MCR6481707.1 hypothetical protein [Amycolatopsis iheyensis]